MQIQQYVAAVKTANVDSIQNLITSGLSLKRRFRVELEMHAVESSILTLLGIAIYYDQPDVVKLLIPLGVNVNSKETLKYRYSQKTMTPLCMTVSIANGNACKITKLLLAADAKVDVPMFLRHTETEEEGGTLEFHNENVNSATLIETPMIWVIHRNHSDLLEELLNAGVDPLFLYTNKTHNRFSTDEYIIFSLSFLNSTKCRNRLLRAGGIIPESTDYMVVNQFYNSIIALIRDCDDFVELHNTFMSIGFPLYYCVSFLKLYWAFTNYKTRFCKNLIDTNKDQKHPHVAQEQENESLLQQNQHRKFCKHLWSLLYERHQRLFAETGAKTTDVELLTRQMDLDWNETSVEEAVFYYDFYNHFSQPRSLKCFCRQTIRSCIGRIKLVLKISYLPLPSHLQNFLYFNIE